MRPVSRSAVDPDNLRSSIAHLRALGFSDPAITSLPAILSYAIDNIRRKIGRLRELGLSIR